MRKASAVSAVVESATPNSRTASWAASRSQAYTSLLGVPCGERTEARPTLTEADVHGLIPVVRREILAGGLRLGRLLDDALGPEARAPGQKTN